MSGYPCPVCNNPPLNIDSLLERIEDTRMLVELALDVGERVANLTVDPGQAQQWLVIAKGWQKDPKSVEEAEVDARIEETQADWGGPGYTREAQCAGKAVLCAVRAAAWANIERPLDEAQEAYLMARQASRNEKAEEARQFSRIQELACTCPALLAAAPSGPRCRVSLLAE